MPAGGSNLSSCRASRRSAKGNEAAPPQILHYFCVFSNRCILVLRIRVTNAGKQCGRQGALQRSPTAPRGRSSQPPRHAHKNAGVRRVGRGLRPLPAASADICSPTGRCRSVVGIAPLLATPRHVDGSPIPIPLRASVTVRAQQKKPGSHRVIVRAINDEVEPAPVGCCDAWHGGPCQPLLGDNRECFPRDANPCSPAAHSRGRRRGGLPAGRPRLLRKRT